MAWFKRKGEEPGGKATKVVIAEGLWIKCDSCKEIMYRAEVERAGRVCPKCHYPFRISARERLGQLADPGSFEERETGLATTDPLAFKDTKKYRERIRAAAQKTTSDEAVICGIASIGGFPPRPPPLQVRFLRRRRGPGGRGKPPRPHQPPRHKHPPPLPPPASGGPPA